MPEPDDAATPVHGMWSGTISFGLVSVPVALYPALRSRSVHLRMLTKDGGLLQRRYYCPADGQELEADDLVRGYEKEDGGFVIVEDEELEELEPRKSSDIELKQFVKIDEIGSLYFDRPYFLAPTGRSTKAYRLLVHAMEEKGRAGIATFVMRGKEYLAAILAENGLLTVEMLRYSDELRTPQQVGLPDRSKTDWRRADAFARALSRLKQSELADEQLEDRYARRFHELVAKKKKTKAAVVKPKAEEEMEEGGKIIDLVAIFKERFAKQDRGGGNGNGRDDLEDLSRGDLYERARKLNISGRSKMTKEELAEAIRAEAD